LACASGGSISSRATGVMTFPRVNPNGQFGWLDQPGEWPLDRAVLDAVSTRHRRSRAT